MDVVVQEESPLELRRTGRLLKPFGWHAHIFRTLFFQFVALRSFAMEDFAQRNFRFCHNIALLLVLYYVSTTECANRRLHIPSRNTGSGSGFGYDLVRVSACDSRSVNALRNPITYSRRLRNNMRQVDKEPMDMENTEMVWNKSPTVRCGRGFVSHGLQILNVKPQKPAVIILFCYG